MKEQCKKILKTQKQYNEEYRVGDEFFIPQGINDSILNNDISEQLKDSCSNTEVIGKQSKQLQKINCDLIKHEHDCLEEGCTWDKKCMKEKVDFSKQLEKFKSNICKLQKNKKSCSSLNYCDLKSTSLLSSKKVCVKKQYGGKIKKVNKRSKKRSKINKK